MKNEVVTILKYDDFGRGIAYIDKKIIFIYDALINETVEVKIKENNKNYCVGEVVKYISKSLDRVDSNCEYSHICGGCDLRHMSYKATIDFKQSKIEGIMHKYAHIDSKYIKEIIPSKNENQYRNKIKLSVNKGLGLFERKSNRVVNIDHCLLMPDKTNEVIKKIKDTKNIKSLTIKEARNTNDLMLVVDGKLNKQDITTLTEVTSIYEDNINTYGNDKLYEKLNDYVFVISPNSFFQVNTEQSIKLYDKAKEYLDLNKEDILLDLYCGTGTIGIYMANEVKKVLGIEISEDAILDANENKIINKINNIEFINDDVANALNKLDYKPNKVIVDPPRKGLDTKTIKYLNDNKFETLVYISCDPMTLARDLKDLTNYNLIEITPVDMFPYTYHVECVALLSKINID